LQGFDDVRIGDVIQCVKIEEKLQPFVEEWATASAETSSASGKRKGGHRAAAARNEFN